MQRRWKGSGILAICAVSLYSGDLPPEIQAKFVKILAASAGSTGKVACKDASILAELEKLGLANDSSSKIAWAASEGEVKSFKAAGKLVICGKLDWTSAGATIVIVEEGGKPQIYLHSANLATTGVTLSDAVLKICKRL